ncbi:MAG: cell division protein FtsA [Methyloligellaceae bacterium]
MARQKGHGGGRQRIIGVLDVGSSKICCLIARAISGGVPGGGLPVQVIGFGHQRSDGIKSGTIVNMDAAELAIRAAVDQAEQSAGVTLDEVYISVSCGRLKSDTFAASIAIAGNEVRSHDVERLARAGWDYAARDGRAVLHCISTGYRLDEDTVISDPRGMLADRLSVDIHSVTADDLALKNLILCVERCHLAVAGAAAAPYASGLASVVKDEAQLGVTCIDMGAGTTTVSVFSEGQYIFCDAIALGGNHVTIDLARALSTTLEAAERIKTLHGSVYATASDDKESISFPNVGEESAPELNKVPRSQVAHLIQPRVEEILHTVRERLDAAGLASSAGQKVVVTGGASQLTGLTQFAGHVLGKSVRHGRPRALRGLPERGIGPAFATAIGLLVYAQRPLAELVPAAHGPYRGTGTGYLSRVGQWIRESF